MSNLQGIARLKIHHGKLDEFEVWVGGGQPVSRQGLPPTAGLATRFFVNGSRPMPD